MKRSLLLRIVFFAFMLFVVACDNPGDIAKKIKFIDITGARALLVSPASGIIKASSLGKPSSLSKSSAGNEVFAKINSDNSIEQVELVDVDGDVVNDLVPSAIINATDEYMIIKLDIPYLVNKISGSAYDLSPVGMPDMGTQSGYFSRPRVYSDSSGNIYFVASNRVKKIDISDPERVTAENYTVDLDSVYEFAVDSAGNVIYSRTGDYGLPLEPCRIRKSNGGLYNTGSEYKGFFTGLDGNLYCNYWLVNDGTATVDAIYKIVIDESYAVSFSQYGNIGSQITDWGHLLLFDDRILNVNCQDQIIYEVFTLVGYPRASTSALFLLNGILVKQSPTYFYVAKSSGAIIKINPDDYSYTTLISDGNYEIYNLDATADDTIYFNALRLSDGKKVLGSISPTGTIEIIDDTLTEEIIILQKVN
jgi:hypothetical protein